MIIKKGDSHQVQANIKAKNLSEKPETTLNIQDRVSIGGETTSTGEAKELKGVELFAKPLPKFGWIEGKANNQKVRLDFDRTSWTIGGTTNKEDVKLSIDHDNGNISGKANGKQMNIDFDWSPDRIVMKDKTNGLFMDLDWEKGSLKGKLNGEKLNIKFDMKNGTIKDASGKGDLDLNYNKTSGLMKGTMGGSELNVNIVNLDMHDFLNHYYLFAK